MQIGCVCVCDYLYKRCVCNCSPQRRQKRRIFYIHSRFFYDSGWAMSIIYG